jgi:hypothetical protein
VIRLGPCPNRDELLAAVRIVFDSDAEEAIRIVDELDLSKWKESPERVQMTVLALSEGGLDKLREFTREANRDYRNVLYWSEFTKPGTERRLALEQRLADAGLSPWNAG